MLHIYTGRPGNGRTLALLHSATNCLTLIRAPSLFASQWGLHLAWMTRYKEPYWHVLGYRNRSVNRPRRGNNCLWVLMLMSGSIDLGRVRCGQPRPLLLFRSRQTASCETKTLRLLGVCDVQIVTAAVPCEPMQVNAKRRPISPAPNLGHIVLASRNSIAIGPRAVGAVFLNHVYRIHRARGG